MRMPLAGAAVAGLLALAPLAAAGQESGKGQPDLPQRGSAPTAGEANRAADTSQRGSRGSTAGGEERTGPPAAGIESGNANGLAGGRTDEGPRGGTGIREDGRARHEHARARKNSQARGRNKKGSLARPADSPPQINRDPKPMGSGAPMTPPGKEPQPEGRNYPAGPQPGGAGGIASDTGDSSAGAAATTGTAGKAAPPQPEDKK